MNMTGIAVRVSSTLGALILMSGCATVPRLANPQSHISNHIVLVGHGIPANDYPKDRLGEFFRMHSHDHTDGADSHAHGTSERDIRDREIREWPRTPENDPYKYGVEAIARRLQSRTGHHVLVAFNEFCAPTVEQAIDDAVRRGARRVMVVPTMTTPGGGHSEKDIPARIETARRRHPDIEIVYAWPFDTEQIATTLADQLKRFELDAD